MAIPLIAGVVVGALAVLFILQNVAVATIVFLWWQITGSLALIVLAALIIGIVLTLLALLPIILRHAPFKSIRTKKKEKVEQTINDDRPHNELTPSITEGNHRRRRTRISHADGLV